MLSSSATIMLMGKQLGWRLHAGKKKKKERGQGEEAAAEDCRHRPPVRSGSARAAAAILADKDDEYEPGSRRHPRRERRPRTDPDDTEDYEPPQRKEGGLPAMQPRLVQLLDDIDFDDYDVAIWDIPNDVFGSVKQCLKDKMDTTALNKRYVKDLVLLVVGVKRPIGYKERDMLKGLHELRGSCITDKDLRYTVSSSKGR
ncbi:unnamed protein product [Vitrella brassicaformis CCMP3155]|uniref:Uncharacterized protein n=1 Tax=Vitrella brassicaformis (strain CCMP3155) TaxID=1169540 RepID=A0A0G4EPN6_VITBC|nr:unnamed protein product [Vitrella brassicaformis CCMP3155]|eukprot:CEL99793.1 unnamed protein product [Vitrella brassicaformis CCMP3155]